MSEPVLSESESDADEIAVPQSQAEWKSRIASAPGKDLLKLVQRDAPRANRVLSGFRATEQGVKNPVVLARVADEAMKQPGFASELAASFPPVSVLAPPDPKPAPPVADAKPAPPSVPTGEQAAQKDARLREQVDKQRAALKEKEERIAALERDAAQAKRELQAVRTDLDAARIARAAADAEAANLRRRAERDAKRVKDAEAETKPLVASTPEPIAHKPTHTATPYPLEEALRRLLRRGKFAAVAEVCKEALLGGGLRDAPAMARGAVYALYAAALYGTGEADRAADQDNRAAEAFLDAGAVPEATDAFTRLLSQPTLLRSTLADDATLLRRLVALAERDNKIGLLTTAFLRVRIVSPQGFNLLLSSLTRKVGKRGAEIAATVAGAARENESAGIGADETVTLPGAAFPALSPRKLADAVETGESRFVMRVRDVLAEMRQSGDIKKATLADSLLVAVGELNRIAVLPLTTAHGFTPRCAIGDASNIARHNPDPLSLDNAPRVASLMTMRDFLFRRGFFPVLLYADATLRFHVDDKAAYLVLVEKGIVRETAPQTSADETLLKEARERDATLVSNDRFSDWGDAVRRVERLGFTLTASGVALLPQ